MKNTALIVIDIQKDYFPGGVLALEQPEQAAGQAKRLLDLFRERQLPIVHIQHENLNPRQPYMLPNSEGMEIYPLVRPLANERLFIKHYPNAFWETGLESYLREQDIKRLVIVGMMTHMCVSSTTRGAMERGFATTVIDDACATRALALYGKEIPAETVHRTALAELTLIVEVKPLAQFVIEISEAA